MPGIEATKINSIIMDIKGKKIKEKKNKPHNPLSVEAATAAASPRRQETFYEVASGDGGQPTPREAGPGSGAP